MMQELHIATNMQGAQQVVEPNNSQITQEWKSRHRNAPTCMNDVRETTGTKRKQARRRI